MQILSTVEVSATSKGTKFCDEFGYDYTPIYFMQIKTQLGHSTTKMLNGEPRTDGINGKSSKIFHDPLTTRMSKCIGVAKNTKEDQEHIKHDALAKGKARAAQHWWQRRLQIKNIEAIDHALPPTPMLTVGLETPTNMHKALLDFGADTNVLPLAVYNCLKNKAAMAKHDVLYSFQNTPVQSQGVVNVLLHINGVSTKVSFQVVDCQDDEQLILGKPWIYKHQCMLNFANLRIQFTIGANQFNLPMIDEVNTSVPLSPKLLQTPKPMQSRKAVADNKKGFPSPWQYQQWVPKANLEAQGYNKGNLQVWVPK